MVKLLLANGANVNQSEREVGCGWGVWPRGGLGCRLSCCPVNRPGRTAILIRAPTLPHSTRTPCRRLQLGASPLFVAAQEGITEVVSTLVSAGADVNQLSVDGRTPLFAASARGHADVVCVLLQAGADSHIATKVIRVRGVVILSVVVSGRLHANA